MRVLKTTAIAALVGAILGCAHQTNRDRVIDYLALRSASVAGDEMLVRALLARGAPVNPLGPDVAGNLSYMALQADTPLQAAAENGHLEIVQLLVSKGAWLDAQCCDSLTPLGLAAKSGHIAVVRFLLEAGADPQRAGGEGTPLEVAAKAGHFEVVRILESTKSAPK